MARSKPKIETIGEILKSARLNTGDSQSDLARRSGIVANHISRLEKGEKAMPRFDTVVKLADELGISLDELAVRSGLRRPPTEPLDAESALAKRSARRLHKLVAQLEELTENVHSVADALESPIPQNDIVARIAAEQIFGTEPTR